MSLATLTTVLGFLGLVLSPSPPVKLVGVAVALGVAVSLLLCMTLVPVLMSRLDPQRSRVNRWDISLEKLGNAVVDHKKTVALTFLFVLLPSIWLTAKNVVSDNIFEYFPASHQFSQDTRIVEQRFSGINRVLYSVAGPEKYSILSKVYLDDLERFTNWLEQQPEVSRVVSAGDISQLVEARREGRLQARLDYYKKHVSGKGPDTLNLDGINADYSATLISVYLRPLGSAQMVAFDRRSRDWLGSQLGDYAVQSGGPALLFAYLGEKNIRGMLMALSMGLIIASVLLGFALRSLRIGFIAFFCNIFPILAIYAVWAMFNGRISLGAAVVMGMILGIVVDDTIYLLTKYQQGRLSRQADPIKYALRRVGPALIITSLTLVAGLGLGLLSKFGPIWSMSLLSASIIAVALITVLLLLPALLGLAEKRQPEKVVAHD
jgi:predicted RND superfamily exporter protein